MLFKMLEFNPQNYEKKPHVKISYLIFFFCNFRKYFFCFGGTLQTTKTLQTELLYRRSCTTVMFQSVNRRHKFFITYIKIRIISKITYFRRFRMVKEIMEIDIKQKMTEKRTFGNPLC